MLEETPLAYSFPYCMLEMIVRCPTPVIGTVPYGKMLPIVQFVGDGLLRPKE